MSLINPDFNLLTSGAAVSATDVFAVMQGGNDRKTTASAIKTYAQSDYTASAAEINLNDDLPASFSFTPAAGGTNECIVTIQAKDAAGTNMARSVMFIVWLSDAATGLGVTGTAASGTVAASGSDGFDIGILTAKKALVCQTKANGEYKLTITDSAKTGYRVCAIPLMSKSYSISAALVAGNYGA